MCVSPAQPPLYTSTCVITQPDLKPSSPSSDVQPSHHAESEEPEEEEEKQTPQGEQGQNQNPETQQRLSNQQ